MDKRLRVLMVEDSAEDAALLLRCLKRAGYTTSTERVETADTMKDALSRGPWDVVVSDHRMPLFSALGALGVLRERALDLPFIIVSGNIGEELVVAAMQNGASDYVLKDDLTRLVPAIERALSTVTQRQKQREAEEALRESEERFSLAVRGSRDGLWDWNLSTGQVYYSTRFKEMLGFQEHELQGVEAFVALIDEAFREGARAALRDHLVKKIPLDVELCLVTKQGESRWFCVRGQALWDERGRATRLAGSLSDLTSRKRAEVELKEQLDIIRRQQEDIRVLSTPIIEVWDGVLTMPVLGALDGERAQAILDALLAAVARSRCSHLIIDVTGVASMDAATAKHLILIFRSIQLLGARGIVVGIQASVARAIVSLGVEMPSVMKLGNLRQALLWCMRERGEGVSPVARPAF
ncbi:MAG: PAS domain S-box protein [Byssovorax sp.]